MQVPYVLQNLGGVHSRAGHLASARHVLAFYGHDVVLPALGWHLAWRLQSFAGRNGPCSSSAGSLSSSSPGPWSRSAGNRVFVLTALLTGFALTAVGATLFGVGNAIPGHGVR